MTNNEQTCVIF